MIEWDRQRSSKLGLIQATAQTDNVGRTTAIVAFPQVNAGQHWLCRNVNLMVIMTSATPTPTEFGIFVAPSQIINGLLSSIQITDQLIFSFLQNFIRVDSFNKIFTTKPYGATDTNLLTAEDVIVPAGYTLIGVFANPTAGSNVGTMMLSALMAIEDDC